VNDLRRGGVRLQVDHRPGSLKYRGSHWTTQIRCFHLNRYHKTLAEDCDRSIGSSPVRRSWCGGRRLFQSAPRPGLGLEVSACPLLRSVPWTRAEGMVLRRYESGGGPDDQRGQPVAWVPPKIGPHHLTTATACAAATLECRRRRGPSIGIAPESDAGFAARARGGSFPFSRRRTRAATPAASRLTSP
jgi:hypothetical protein